MDATNNYPPGSSHHFEAMENQIERGYVAMRVYEEFCPTCGCCEDDPNECSLAQEALNDYYNSQD